MAREEDEFEDESEDEDFAADGGRRRSELQHTGGGGCECSSQEHSTAQAS